MNKDEKHKLKMAQIILSKNFMLIISCLILSSAQYTYTAPTTLNPLELTFKVNSTKYAGILNPTEQSRTQTSTAYVVRNVNESDTVQSTTVTTTLAKKIFDNKLKKLKIDSTQQTNIFSASLSSDKQQKEHSRKSNSKGFKDKIPSKNSTSTGTFYSETLSHDATKESEQQTTRFTALELENVQSTPTIPPEALSVGTIITENSKRSDGSMPKNEDTTTLAQFHFTNTVENLSESLQIGVTQIPLRPFDASFQKDNESEQLKTNLPVNSSLNENLEENHHHSNGFSSLSQNDSINVKVVEHPLNYFVVKTTTATTTPDYNAMEKSRNVQELPLNGTENIIYSNDDVKSIVTTENFNDIVIKNSNKTTESSTTLDSDVTVENTTPDLEEETKENIVKLFEVEKIDSKSMDNYQEQMTAMLEQNSNADGNLKKKNIGIMMGHDGVKATKKKQLMEKHFSKDDDIFTKTQITKVDGADVGSDGMRIEDKKLVDSNDDDRILGRMKDNEDSEYEARRNTSVEETKVHSHFDDDDGNDDVGKTKMSNLENNEAHLKSLIMGENFLENNKNNNLTVDIKENGLKDVSNVDRETTSEKFEVENIPADFDALDIETNAKKMKTNEKLRFIERTNFTSPQSRTKFDSEPIELLNVSTMAPQSSTEIQNPFQQPNRQENVVVLTLTSFGSEQNIVNRTDATEPQVVTERSLISNSFTNVQKDSEKLDIGMTTLENVETVPTSNYQNSNLTIDLILLDDSVTQKVTETGKIVDVDLSNSDSKLSKSDHIESALINADKQNKDIKVESDGVSIIDLDFLNSTRESHSSKTNTTKSLEFNTSTKENNNKNQTDFAGIEIQINVSEGTGDGQSNSSQMLEFSFRRDGLKQISFKEGRIQNDSLPLSQSRLSIYEGAESQKSSSASSDTLQNENEYPSESDILVVEITDGGNVSDYTNSNSNENERYTDENPKFTIHNDRTSDYDSAGAEISKPFSDYENENSKMKPLNRELGSDDDDLFIPDLKLEPLDEFSSTSNRHDKSFGKEASIDRDSDTIFYISNTEVKVVESKPTSNSLLADHNGKSDLQSDRIKTSANERLGSSNQDLPSIYEEDVIIDFPTKNTSSNEKKDGIRGKSDRFEEDIILSPLKNNFDSLKVIKDQNLESFHGTENKSKGNVAESFIEIEESSNVPDNRVRKDPNTSEIASSAMSSNKSKSLTPSTETNENSGIMSNVIIEPAVIPEMSIGVPVIGELPPQIQLKEIDFMPQDSKDFNIDTENVDDGIQYGGDLIARETSGVNYGIDSGYDFVNSNNNNNKDEIRNHGLGVGNSDNDVDNYGAGVTSQIVMHAVDNLQKEQLVAELPSESATATEMRDVPIKRGGNGINTTIPEKLGNATAYSVLEENEGEFNFTDLQTLILACFTTLVPLILLAAMGYVVRFLWIKYNRHDSQGGSLVEDNSTDPLAAKSMNLSQDELKSTDSGITINRRNDTLESNTDIQTKYRDDDDDDGGGGGGIGGCIGVGGGDGGNGNCGDNTNGYSHTQSVSDSTNIDIHRKMNGIQTTDKINHSGANGSVITMTLKNNHLIVETEERNDISRDARETKMHYTPSEKDGVFVVEVARGADSKGIPPSPRNDNDGLKKTCTIDIETSSNMPNGINKYSSSNHEEVQIHQPPPDGSNDEIDSTRVEANNDSNNLSPVREHGSAETNLRNSNIGLSQSDLSTSSEDSNKGYTYGNQQLYESNNHDSYTEKSNSMTAAMIKSPSFTPSGKLENETHTNGNSIHQNHNVNNDHVETKPIIKAALLKQDTVIEVTSATLNSKIPIKNMENGDIMIQQQEQQTTNGSISPSHNGNNNNGDVNDTENGFDSIISLPAPPSTEEIKQLNDIILAENTQLDSLPPPPPPTETQDSCNSNGNNENDTVTNVTLDGIHDSHSTEGQNGVTVLAVTGTS